MADLEIHVPMVSITEGSATEITVNNYTQTDITLDTTRIAEVSTNNYVLSSGGMYGAGYSGGIPGWLSDAITARVFTALDGTISIDNLTTALETLIRGASEGVAQQIVRVDNLDESLSALITTVKAESDLNNSTVTDLVTSYASDVEAFSTDLTALRSMFGEDAEAWALNVLSTYTSQTEANSQSLTNLSSTILDPITGVEVTATAVSALSTSVGLTDGVADGTGLLQTVAILQNQIDGNITTWFGDVEPTMLNYPVVNSSTPANSWEEVNTDGNIYNDYSAHIGDIYYDRTTGFAYRFAHENLPADNPDLGIIYSWIRIVDNDVVLAIANAAKAQDTADGKRIIFYNNVVPSNIVGANGYTVEISTGDLWIPSADVSGYLAGEVYSFNVTAWIKSLIYTDDTKAQNIINGIEQLDLSEHVNSLGWQTDTEVSTAASSTLSTWISTTYDADQVTIQSELDGKIESYFNSAAPYANGTDDLSKDGDLWYNTVSKELYRYVHSTLLWTIIEDQVAIDAATAASTAQSTADGKIVTYFQVSEPLVGLTVGDIWIDIDNNNKMHRYNGSTWDYFRDDTALDSFLTVTYASDISGIFTQIDNKSVSYFQETEPFTVGSGTLAQDGDVWFNSTTQDLKVFKYDVTTPLWNLVTDPKAVEAYNNASTAQATADGKIQNFIGEPTHPYYRGDTWMQGPTGDIYVAS